MPASRPPQPERTALSLGLALLLSGCASPVGGNDIDLFFAPSTVPGVGAAFGLSQKIGTYDDLRVDVELDLTHQELQDPGPDGQDDLDQVRFGFKSAWPAESEHQGTLRLGVAWLRILGDSKFIDGTGDFGGGYLGLGYQLRLSEHLSFNPDVSLVVVDAEGGGDFGQLVELTWRLIWHL